MEKICDAFVNNDYGDDLDIDYTQVISYYIGDLDGNRFLCKDVYLFNDKIAHKIVINGQDVITIYPQDNIMAKKRLYAIVNYYGLDGNITKKDNGRDRCFYGNGAIIIVSS